ncbi:alpha/beta hydrolase [Klebsiella oxytoca]|uniref:alpha/beta hydrolase n=1 Tax=Klebsiella TaxID=570 RepID=UPI0013CF8659|nr:alpha/beta hydrolase [Klebsiella oxytoca]EKU6745596.1 alpha/beta hydrolase [Klebsiella oxytoca]EKU7139429.1 alpha/beta hydrolase [Klebsiella oxytoca]EKV0271453.1 alpha/beta hydrolase [Klebsiella oxytoca]EKV1584590.1 alpha/beta hydrolase [Klebsiella oxytoca]EKV9014926.1 alpha/beta hydrolase [Klebsiella oxytoca]
MLSNGAKDYKAKLFENHDENIHFLLNTPLSLQRQVWESAAIKATLPAGVCIETVNDTEITAEWISYPDSINTRIILYFHGGGNSQGSCLTHRKLAACLAQYSGCRTLVLEYPLAPENRFPAALLNCHQAYLWLLANGYSAEDIILAGDSSGGGLVMSLLLLLKQHQDPLPDSSVLLSPMLDFTLSGKSITLCKDLDPLLCIEDLIMTVKYYCSDSERSDPLVSPLFGDLSGLPPLFIQVGSEELLRDDALRLSRYAKKAGMQVELEIWDGLWHVFQSSVGKVPEADEALQAVAKFIRSRESLP